MTRSCRRFGVAVLSWVAALSCSAAAAADEPADDVVFLKGGGRVRGSVMSEDPTAGVAVKLPDGSTRRIAAGAVERVAYASDAPAPSPAPPAQPQPEVGPSPAAAPPAAAPAPPPSGGAFGFGSSAHGGGPDEPVEEKKDWKRARSGLSFGLNAGGGYMPGIDAGGGLLTCVLNAGAGVVDFRFHFGAYAGGGDFGGSLGPIVISETRINLGSVYSLAAGGLFGMAYDTETENAGALVGALITPAAFRFGPSRQFEIGLFGGPTYNFDTEYLGGVGGQSFSVLFL